jgi:hypothetical protein
MKNLEWVRELVESERRMEETGIIDISAIHDETRELQTRTIEFLKEIKEHFVDYTTAFNNMKNSPLGNVKIYGISNTVTDFMLFRNGYKLLFSATAPGRIAISFQNQAPTLIPHMSTQPPVTEECLDAQVGAFGEINWTYHGSPVNIDSLVRYYTSRFIRESAK